MWCPNCKNEYREGITVCPDCKCDLVAELVDEEALIEIFRTFEAPLKDKIVKYLQHLNINVTVRESKATEDEIAEFQDYAFQSGIDLTNFDPSALSSYTIIVPKESKKEAVREVQTIIKVESEKALEATDDSGEESEGLESAIPSLAAYREPSKEFVKAKDRASDYKSSGWTFIIIGILILVFMLLSILGIIPYDTYLYSKIIFIILGAGALVIGVLSVLKSKKIASSIDDEDKKENEIIDFLKQSITKENIDSLFADNADEQEEIIWMKLTESIKTVLLRQFPNTNSEYADELIENFLNEITDK